MDGKKRYGEDIRQAFKLLHSPEITSLEALYGGCTVLG